jgi:hypothetical protein
MEPEYTVSDPQAGSLRGLADKAADSARSAQLDYQGALISVRQTHATAGTSTRGEQDARYSAKLAEDRATTAMQAWAEAEIDALQARIEARARAADEEASAERVRNARKAAQARWAKRVPEGGGLPEE